MFARSTTTPWPLVALFTAGYLAPYLLPTTVGRLDAGLPLSATQAGAVGSALLLSSAAAGFLLASRIDRVGPRTLARIGLALAVLGYGSAALTHAVPAVIAGAVVGGIGSGTATTVAASGIAAMGVPPARGCSSVGEGPPPRLHARPVVRVGARGCRLSDGPAPRRRARPTARRDRAHRTRRMATDRTPPGAYGEGAHAPGTAAGPLAGSVLSARAGFPAMGAILAVGLVVIAVPMTGVALYAGRRRVQVSQIIEIPVETIPLETPVPHTYDTTPAA